MTSPAPAIAGTAFGETNDTASILVKPASESASIRPDLASTGTGSSA